MLSVSLLLYQNFQPKVDDGAVHVMWHKLSSATKLWSSVELSRRRHNWTEVGVWQVGITGVVRLNRKAYDRRRFTDHGLSHYDLYFPDGRLDHYCLFLLLIFQPKTCRLSVIGLKYISSSLSHCCIYVYPAWCYRRTCPWNTSGCNLNPNWWQHSNVLNCSDQTSYVELDTKLMSFTP